MGRNLLRTILHIRAQTGSVAALLWCLLAMLACKTSIDGPRINKLESEKRATISLERSVRYKNGLSMVLRNVSSVALWVNARGALNSEGDPAAFREVWLEVNDERDRRHGYNCFAKPRTVIPDDYRVLPPSESLEIHLDTSCYDLVPGRYRAVAHYQDGNKHPPRAPSGAAHLDGLLQSLPMAFDVVP
jgi:hypothetical protein